MKKNLNSPSLNLRPIVIGLLFLATSALAGAQTEKAIYTFLGQPDGRMPEGPVVFDRSGNLYGATPFGGAFGLGSIYKLTRSGSSWTETILYSFGTTTNDATTPVGNVVFDAKGNLYGAAALGGVNGAGAVFELSPPAISGGTWTETTLYSFSLVDTKDPAPCGLLWLNGLHLYGVAMMGGTGNGSIFELTPPATSGGSWLEQTIYAFTGGSDGKYPGFGCGPLIADKSGNLYGSTEKGGSTNNGTVFELSPPATSGGSWTKNILYSFASGTSDGQLPAGPLAFDANGNLFGTTDIGGSHVHEGTVFELTPAGGGLWSESIVYSFGGFSTDGYGPYDGVLFDKAGNMYGTTVSSVSNNNGTVWELTPPATSGEAWTETILHNFTGGSDGGEPYSPLIAGPSGVLYGTTLDGGGSNSAGVVYQLVP